MLIDNLVTRLPDGITNAAVGSIFASMKQPNPLQFHQYLDDFDVYVAADWTVTETGVATQALADGDGGLLLITNAAADNDNSFSQKVGESFLFATGKRLFFETKFQVSDATQSDIVIGLQITDTAPLVVSDGVYFLKADAATSFSFIAEKDSVEVSDTGIGTLADATDITLSFFWDGIDRIWYAVNGTVTGSITPGDSLPDDEELTLSFGIQNGEAVAKTMTLDYLYAAKER